MSSVAPTADPMAYPEGLVGSNNKLWMGDVGRKCCMLIFFLLVKSIVLFLQLEPYMDDSFLGSMFAQFGYHVQSIRWIRNYQTGSDKSCTSLGSSCNVQQLLHPV